MAGGETVVTVTTTRTTQQSSSTTSRKVGFNIRYFITVPGILKLIQVVLGIICLALIVPVLARPTYYFLSTVIIAFIITIIWCFIYLLEVKEHSLSAKNWILAELVTTILAAIMYFAAFIVQFDAWGPVANWLGFNWPGVGRNIMGGVFGILNFIAYMAGTYFLFVDYRSK